MRVTRYFAVKVIIVILYLLTVCHSYPSSVGIENDKNEEMKKSFKQKTKNIIFNNVNTTPHQNIKINLKRFDRSVDSESPELGAMDPLTHDDLNLSEILVTSSPAETTQQNNSCCGQKINLYFKTTVSIIKQWLDSLVDDCNKVNEILTFETTNKSDIENIRYCCTELKGNYFKLFKSVISALKKLQIDNHSAINNTCPILAGLEKIKNNIITFTQRPNKIMMMNNPFDNLLKRFSGMSVSTNEIPQNTSNNSNSMINHENTGLNKVIENLRNVPQKIKVSIKELINNIRKNLTPGSCQKLQGSTDGNTSDHVDNRSHSSIHQKLPFLNPFENVLKLRIILNFPFNNPISQVFNNLRDLPQQIKEIIDEQISNIRDIFTKNDCREVAEMTNNDSGGNNSSDSSNTHEKVSSQEPSNGLVKNWFNSSMIGRYIDNNPFSQAFNNLRNIPQKIRKSIDDVISNIRNILTSGKYKESKAMLIRSDSNPVTNSSVLDNISSRNPFVDKLNFPSLLKSPFNNPFSQVFDNLRNLLQQIRKTIDEQISIIRNLFTKNNCKKLITMTNNDSTVNNSSDSTHEKLSTQEPSNGLVKNWFGSPIIEKSTVNNPFSQAFDNLRNIPQKIRKSIDDAVNNIRNILTSGKYKESKAMPNRNDSDLSTNSSVLDNILSRNPFADKLNFPSFFKSPFNNPISQVFNNLRDLPQQIKEIIDEQISNIRDIFTKNDCREVAEMTNNDSGGNNSSDSSNTHEKVSSQEPSNGLVKNWFNSSMIGRSIVNNPFSQAFNNLRNIPQKIRKSIDDVISNIRNILTSGKCKEFKAIPNHSDSDLITNSSVQNNISFQNPFTDKLEFPSLLKSPFNNPFSQVFDNLRNLLQQIRQTIDEQINILRNLFTKNNCKKLTSMTNNDSRVNNSSDSSTHEKLSTQEPSNDLVKNWFGSPIIEKSTVNNRFSQAFDNLRNIPQRIRKSIDESISKIRNILIPERSKGLENKINHTLSNPVTDSSDAVVHKTTPSSKPGDVLTVTTDSPVGKILSLGPLSGLFNKLINSSTTSKDPITSSTNPFLQAFDHLRNLPEKMQKSIGEQISHLRNILTKNNHQESKTIANDDTTHPNADNNPINFFNMLFKDMRKTSTPVKVLSHNSQLFGKNIDEISTNIRNFFVPQEPQEPKTETDIFDPSHIYKILSSSPFVLNELFTNIFKSLSDTKSSRRHHHFSAARDIFHNLGKDARKSISALFGGVQHMLISHIRKRHQKQPTASKILIQQPYYELFKKQLYHKPLSLPTRKILPFSSSFHKNKLFSRSRSDSSKYNFLKKFL